MVNQFAAALPDRFFLDVAIGVHSFDEICQMYELDPDHVRQFGDDPTFVQRSLIAKQAVEDDGRAAKARCRQAVSRTVHRVERMVEDPSVTPAVQLDAWKTLAKFAGLEPKQDQNAGAVGPHLTLTIVAPGGEKHIVGQTIDQRVLPEPEHPETIGLTDFGWCEVAG